MKVKISRGIATKLICCTALVVLTSVFAFSQNPPPPKSGALLEIDGTAGSTPVHLKIYDSQIHSGHVQAVPAPPCNLGDQIPTDAYVLQGGAPTGCDPSDPYEVTDDNSSTTHQDFGHKDLSGFHIETRYLAEPDVSISTATNNNDGTTTYNYTVTRGKDLLAGETIAISGFTAIPGDNGTFVINSVLSGTFTVTNNNNPAAGSSETPAQPATGTVTGAVCNTSGTICANPDSGFVTITNNTGSTFSGTISLKGNSPVAGDPFCPVGGMASDSSTQDLTTSGPGQSVTLALGSQGGGTKVSITVASASAPNTTYTYTLTSGPDLVAGQTITITGMADSRNNGTFTISAVASGTFTVANASGVNAPSQTGTGIVIKNADSSNCGGFKQAQTLVLSPNVPKTAFFGKDDYQITTLNSANGDTLSVLPVPVPAGPLGQTGFGPFPYNFPNCGNNCTYFGSGQFGTEAPSLPSPLRFNAGSDPNLGGTTFACVPYADFSADGNPVCAELQIECKNGTSACVGFFYNVQNDFNIDGFSLPGGFGGPAFLGHHQVDCPDSAFDQNIFLTYTPASVTFGDPLKGGGSGTPSCWVVAFDPSAAAVTTGSVSSFTGFSGLFPPPTLNPVNRAQAVPLNFTFPTAGLHLCASVNNKVCDTNVSKPWVNFGTFPIDCGTRLIPPGSPETSIAAGGSNLQTISSTPSLTSYRFNWKPQKTAPLNGCVVVVTQFSNGLVVFPDDFKYIK